MMSRDSLDGGVKIIGDDLFGDNMEDEDLRGPDITDADFSFFDEPDGIEADEDEVMGDDGQDGDGNVEMGAVNANGDASIVGTTVKEETTTSLVGRQDPTTSADPVNFDGKPLGKHSHGPNEIINDTPLDDAEEMANGTREVEELLSPVSLRKKLFDSTLANSQNGKRESEFQPLAFNTAMQRNDAKYSLNGSFAFKITAPQTTTRTSATSPYIKPRPPDKLGGRVKSTLTSPLQAVGTASDSSSDLSDSDDADSAYGNGTRSVVSSSTRRGLLDGGFAGEDAMSVAGTNAGLVEEFNVGVKVCIRYGM